MASTGKLHEDRRREIAGVILLGATAFLFIALITDEYQGAARRTLTDLSGVHNALGGVGAVAAGLLYILLGHAAHIVYFITGVWGVMLLRHAALDRLATRVAGLFLMAGSLAGLFQVNLERIETRSFPGGATGHFFDAVVSSLFGAIGANVLGATLAVVGLLLATEFLFVKLSAVIFEVSVTALHATADWIARAWTYLRAVPAAPAKPSRKTRTAAKAEAASPVADDDEASEAPDADPGPRIRVRLRAETPAEDDIPFAHPIEEEALAPAIDPPPAPPAPAASTPAPSGAAPGKGARKAMAVRRKIDEMDELPADYEYPRRYKLPTLDLLDPAPEVVRDNLDEQLRQTSVLLEERLRTFGIEARVTDVTRGPTITRFELDPAPGIKVSRFQTLADDLALALKAHRVRVEAPIPGRGRVGIEAPNKEREPVVLRELLETREFKRAGNPLTLALGKGIAGEVKVADLATMPHLLVAGATGSGKTVCVKTLLASLLFSKRPDELQLMLIDPKMVELSIFNDIPHLITPVVVDPKKAASALNWLITEMEERYRLFAHLRVRNIEVYNESVENGEIEMTAEEEGDRESYDAIRKLPYIVCIIDELADLMMLARAEVEDAIARIAQLARAVGIHLIIATQRPSVDVLTGVIKANFPARVSFQVSSRVDSRCILDEIGAEKLIGRGDMLYLPAGQSKPTRIQGAFVSDEEMDTLIRYLKTQAPPQYRDEIERFGHAGDATADLADETDELFDDAVRVVLETGQASISMVQRRLRVGYTRAARLIDMMEMKGIVGPHLGSKAREILIDS